MPITDPTYIAWTQVGNQPTMIPSLQILYDTLNRIYPLGTPAGKALAAIDQGLHITSSTSPDLNGTYDITLPSQNIITSVAAAISAGLGLPGGGATFVYRDMNNNGHAWPADKFTAFAKIVMSYVYAINLAAGGDGTIPLQPIAID